MEGIWGQLITGVTSLIGVCVTAYFANRKGNRALEEKVDKLVKHDREQYLGILRLTIMNEEIPISERIIAGEAYIKEGGNGDVKQYYQNFLKEHTK